MLPCPPNRILLIDALNTFKDWIFGLGETYNVNPLLFAGIYAGSKLFFFSFLALVLKNLKAKKPIVILLTLAGASFSIPYLYVIIAGENIPAGIYVLIVALFSYGAFSIWKKVESRVQANT